jgi:hypothetical protein
MPLLAVLAIAVAVGLERLLRGEGSTDAPARIVAAAASRLPVHRRDWGQAMVAELAQIHGRARRWQFTAGALRAVSALLPRRRNRMLLVAAGGLIVAAAATAIAAISVPSLSVFTAVLGFLLAAYASLIASRSQRQRLSLPKLIASATAFAGVAASITAVARIAAAHPSATTDHTHVFSVLFALTLVCYLALSQTLPPLGAQAATVLWWGLTGALASGAVWAIAALTTSVGTGGPAVYLWPVGAAATLAVSIGAAAACRSRRAGVRAGVLTAILGALMHFSIDLTALLQLQHYTLTGPYDIAAYPHSGYPDVASYILSDAVAGDILAGLVLYPVTVLALAALGAAAGTGLHQLTARHKPHAV